MTKNISEAAVYLALKESHREEVITPNPSDYMEITAALESLGFFNTEDSISERVSDFPAPQQETLNRCYELRQEGNAFYNALATYPLAPRILDIQYSKILDTIYLTKALMGDFISADDPCLDIGTCTGFMPIVLSRLELGRWVGMDKARSCIEYAKRSSGELLEPDRIPTFTGDALTQISKRQKFKLILNSRGPRMDSSSNDYAIVSDLLEENGIFIYADTPIKNSTEAKRIFNKSGLSLVYRDIAGGFMRMPKEYEVVCISVFVKCKKEPPEDNYAKQYDALWHSCFQEYCNQEVADKPELKTLSIMREYKAKRINF